MAFVAVSVATGWKTPGSARAVDAPALANPVRIRDWLTALTSNDHAGLIGRADTQVLLGQVVRVVEVRGDWVRVVVPSQPTPLDPRGYPVWIPAIQLTRDAPLEADEVATVIVPTTWLTDADSRRVMELSFGTRLPRVGGSTERVEVALDAGRRLWAAATDVVVLPAAKPGIEASASSVIEAARQFLGTRYLWAGTSGFGFDCSGLVYSVFRLHGIELPRDSAPQSGVGRPVARDQLRPGDLVFFGAEGHVHHVAIYVGNGRVLESPRVGQPVRETELSSFADYAVARRVLP
jgi:cell wall-associated NlpC family hydrolase